MKALATLISALALLVAAATAASKPVRSKTADGYAYQMGGVSIGDLLELERSKEDFSLWVTTAARRSGAHLSDVQVKITDTRGKLVFNEALTGPWLFIALPVGRYTVESAFRGQPQARTTNIHSGDHHQIIFYFDSPAELSPEWKSPFDGSPYRGK